MTRGRLLLLGLLGGLLAMGAGLWLIWPRSAITRENAAKIQVGMTLAEVEVILGGPSRDDAGARKVEIDFDPDPIENERLADAQEERAFKDHLMGPRPVQWRSDEVVLTAQFDNGRVTACAACPVRRVAESPFEKLRRWLGL
jgi:hypothetical protein